MSLAGVDGCMASPRKVPGNCSNKTTAGTKNKKGKKRLMAFK